jgi:hypothetical protein
VLERFAGKSIYANAGQCIVNGYSLMQPYSDEFDEALAAFSVAYADQNEKDHAALKRAVSKGKVRAVFEETS